ncbi:MAG: methylated-DNA--[protein]-cysteine S-methyltransferase [Oscillochloridaceae bacterium]|nr:methylated-DNA--[protein]-cysteine S-methyltransferase [Oscillochloridaceae bacterium]
MPQLALTTPLGEITLAEEAGAIVALDWGGGRDRSTPTPLLARAARQLQAYFDGEDVAFDDIPLAPPGTPFQRRVWEALRAIPRGATRGYGDLARTLATSARAVGGACARNPIPILIPCHRVVSADGSLAGYSGGEGAKTKRFLLALEGAL